MRLKDIGYLYSGLTGKSGDDFHVEDSSEGKEFVPFTNIFNNTRIDVSNFCRVRMEDGEFQNRVQTGDLLFLMSSEDYESIGKPAVVSDPVPELYLNSFCRGLRVTRKDVCSEYVNYYLGAEEVREVIRLEARGFTRVNLKVDRLSAQSIELPSLTIQRRIVDYLDEKTAAIDARVAVLEKKLAAYKRLKASVINRAVTRGLDPKAKLKDSMIDIFGRMPIGWSVRQLKSICTMAAGDNLATEAIGEVGTYPVYGGNGQRGWYDQCNVGGTTVIVGRQGALSGNVHLVRGKIWATEHAVVTKCSHEVAAEYLYYNLGVMRLNRLALKCAAQPGLSVSDVLNQFTVLPSLAEQRAIADYLDAECAKIDKMAELVTREIELYKKLKRSLINEVVTGKRKVA